MRSAFVAGEPVAAICAGRTDAGVHAIGQVIHFDTTAVRTPRAWVLGANTKLPPAIALQWAGEVPAGFHARHSGAAPRLPLLHLESQRPLGARTHAQRLDPSQRSMPHAMHGAAQALLGEHDFSAFRSVECQSKTSVRRIESVAVQRIGDYLWMEIVGECLPAPHGAQHRRNIARCAGRPGSRWRGVAHPPERRAPLGGCNRAGRRPVSVARRIPGRLWHSCTTGLGLLN